MSDNQTNEQITAGAIARYYGGRAEPGSRLVTVIVAALAAAGRLVTPESTDN